MVLQYSNIPYGPYPPVIYSNIAMDNHHFIAGKIHDFYGHFQ